MGVSYYGIGGLGVVINLNNVKWPEQVVSSCEHDERIGNAFCPKCGLRVSERIEQNHELIYAVRDALDHEIRRYPGYIFHPVDYDSTQYFFGWGASASAYGCDHRNLGVPPTIKEVGDALTEMVEKVLSTLKAEDAENGWEQEYPILDLVESDQVGMHVFMYAS